MIDVLIFLIALIWIAGTCLRIYRQARFYQIEEYMSKRYLRWLFTTRERWLPTRPTAAALIGSAFAFLSEAPNSPFPAVIGVIAALIAVAPPSEGEIKKKFRATDRAKRLLGAAFVVTGLLVLIGYALINGGVSNAELRVIAMTLFGFAAFVCAPFLLVAGSLLMTPVEAFLRQRFIDAAKRVLAQVNPVVIGITGSYGKTTTKSFLAHILNGRYHAYPTPKSFNTMMGVCLAINNDIANDQRVEYFICEMGAYIPGEIKCIADLTHPTISLVVEVGPQHLERFGSLDNIAIAKYEIIKALPPDGVGVFNWDNPYVRDMEARGYPQTRLTVSKTVDPANPPTNPPRFVASEINESLYGLIFRVTDLHTNASEVFVAPNLLGEHNVTNLLMAAAVAVHEGMSLKEIAARVKDLQPAESRLVRQTTPQGITIINDAYSANPVGVVGSLKALALHTSGRRLLITPGMVELGDLMEAENRKFGEIAAQYASDVILVGAQQTAPIKAGLLSAQFPADRLHVVETLSEAVQWYQSNLKAGDTVLFINDLPDTYSR